MRIKIETDEITMEAELSKNETGQKIFDSLPIEGKVNRWGEEIYFSIPVDLTEASDARQEMEVGELGYWLPSGWSMATRPLLLQYEMGRQSHFLQWKSNRTTSVIDIFVQIIEAPPLLNLEYTD
jgi:hypothetical protein